MSNVRYVALDAFRGLTIALMILVNTPGSWSAVYSPLLHADWHGVTATDLIFPFFLFIIGSALYFSLTNSNAKSDAGSILKIIKRSAHWYGKSLAKLKGISKDQADKRLLMAASVLPVEGLEFYAPVKINDGTILTGKAWDDCRAHMATARADKGQVFTGVILLPGQKIRVLPNVGHRWTIGGHEGNYRGSGWYRTGDTFTLDGESKRVAIGTLLVQVGDGPFMRCTKTITGSGKVYVSPFRGSGSGTIDCKIVALPK